MTVMPLSGYSIVDFGQVWAGPILSAICADMGASVIRIESRVGSDMARLAPASPQRELLNSLFIYRNRDYYINLNLKTPEGIRLAKEIIKLGDVVVENFAPGVMTRFGLSYEEVRKVRPDVVMISISAGGQTGPWSDLMGYGPSINSLAGTDGFIGYAGENQLMCNIPDADQTAANMGAFAVLAALYHRKRTGEGQYLDMAFLETLGGLLSEGFMDYQMTGRLPRPSGDHHPDMAVHGFFPCQGTDRWVSVAVKTEEGVARPRTRSGRPFLGYRASVRRPAFAPVAPGRDRGQDRGVDPSADRRGGHAVPPGCRCRRGACQYQRRSSRRPPPPVPTVEHQVRIGWGRG